MNALTTAISNLAEQDQFAMVHLFLRSQIYAAFADVPVSAANREKAAEAAAVVTASPLFLALPENKQKIVAAIIPTLLEAYVDEVEDDESL